MDKETRKKHIQNYKEWSRTQTGGVYIIKNTVNNRILLGAAADIVALKNRFESGKQFGGSFHPKMNKDWAEHGSDAFEIEIVESLEKNDLQTPQEFMADLDILKKMWLDKYDRTLLY